MLPTGSDDPEQPCLQFAESRCGGAGDGLRTAHGRLWRFATRSGNAGDPFVSVPAAIDDIERFYVHLERVLAQTGFHDPARPRRLMPKLRRLFGRAGLEKDEINILRGILDSIEKPTGPKYRAAAVEPEEK